MAHRARAIPEGPADVCPPPGHPRMWLGAEDSRDPGHHCWASCGGQPEEAEWLGQFQVMPHTGLPSGPLLRPAPKHRGSVSRAQPWLSLLPPASVCPVGDPSWSLPCLCVSFPSLLCMCCLFGPSASIFFHSAPGLPLPSALPHSPLLPEPPHPRHHFLFCSPSISFPTSLPPTWLHPPTLSHRKREKKGGITPHKKAQTKTNLECVSKCCVLLVACVSLWPAACSPALPVCRVSCPPACPPCPSCQRHGVQCLGVW